MPKPALPFPADARMFFCIGAQKAGTTWLYDFLQQSPDCHFSRNKELHYFDVLTGQANQLFDLRIKQVARLAEQLKPEPGPVNRHALKLLREVTDLLTIYTGNPGDHGPYLRYLLRGRRKQPVVCDITPAYAIFDRSAYTEMAGIGEAKFLFILRDPVSRMWSQIRMGVGLKGLEAAEFEQACTDHAQVLIDNNRLKNLERANYRHTMEELEAAVPAERIKYVFYEDLFSQKTADEICAFLEIAPIPADATRRVNEGKSLTIPPGIAACFRRDLAAQYDHASDRFGAALPAAWRAWDKALTD